MFQEAFESSVASTSNIIEICSNIENYNLERFIYTSTLNVVYGNFQEEVVTEESSCKPIEIYGTAKLAGEITTKGLCSNFTNLLASMGLHELSSVTTSS